MSLKNFFFFIIIVFLLSSCSKEEKKIEVIQDKSQDETLINTYNEALEAYENGDLFFAGKKFLEAELLFPQSIWASKSVLMASYMFYLNEYYVESIFNLERYISTYPNAKNQSYAYYLIAMNYYQLIEDEKRDVGPLVSSKEWFEKLINKFPDSDFALDAKFKIELINTVMANKEMYIGRHYIKKKKWIAALNRFRKIIDEYETTIFIDEALHRLVEIHYHLGLIQESQKYANMLGYNYNSSEWYEKSYVLFNKDYKIEKNLTIKENKKDKKGLIEKFKKLFD